MKKPTKNKKDYRYWVVEVDTLDRAYFYCVKTDANSSKSLEEETAKAKMLASQEHERLYPCWPLCNSGVLGRIRSFVSEG